MYELWDGVFLPDVLRLSREGSGIAQLAPVMATALRNAWEQSTEPSGTQQVTWSEDAQLEDSSDDDLPSVHRASPSVPMSERVAAEPERVPVETTRSSERVVELEETEDEELEETESEATDIPETERVVTSGPSIPVDTLASREEPVAEETSQMLSVPNLLLDAPILTDVVEHVESRCEDDVDVDVESRYEEDTGKEIMLGSH
jgi:hypothetical protein